MVLPASSVQYDHHWPLEPLASVLDMNSEDYETVLDHFQARVTHDSVGTVRRQCDNILALL